MFERYIIPSDGQIFRSPLIAMNPLYPSSSTTASRAGFINTNPGFISGPGRPSNANERQPYYQRLYDKTSSSSTLRLALSDSNAATQADAGSVSTNIGRFSTGSSTPFHFYDHEPTSTHDHPFHGPSSISYQGPATRSESMEIPFLHQAADDGPHRPYQYPFNPAFPQSVSDKTSSQATHPTMTSQVASHSNSPPPDNTQPQQDANKSKKKHGCWMCHKSFDRPRYGFSCNWDRS